LPVEDYPAAGMHFAGDGHDSATLLGGWDLHRDRPGIGLRDGAAELGFTLPTWARDGDLVLRGEAQGASGLELAVNGTALDVEVSGEDYSAVVPAAVAAAAGEDRLLLWVSDADGDLRLMSLAMEAAS